MKVNDYSRYKNNELKSYFTKKDINYYVSLREKSELKTHSYIVAGFSYIITIFPVNLSKTIEDLNSITTIKGAILIFLKFLLSLAIPLLIGIIYYLLVARILPFISSLPRMFKKFFNRNVVSFDKKNIKKITDEEHIATFNNEVINQTSLILEMLNNIPKEKKELNTKLDIEDKFRLDQTAEYLKTTLKTLLSILYYPNVVEKLSKDKGIAFIHKERFENVIALSERIISEILEINNKESEKIDGDMFYCGNTVIPRIKGKLNEAN